MGLVVVPPSDADEDRVPSVQRLFVPDISQLPANYTSTSVSVDDLVRHCQHAGYLSNSNVNASTANGHGALSMAVQPSASMPTNVASENSEPSTTTLVGPADDPMNPFMVQLQGERELALGKKQADGNNTLTTATKTVTEARSYPYNDMFDPTNEFEMSFFDPSEDNEAMAASGAFAAFSPSANMSMEDMLNLDYSMYVNEDSLL